MVPRLEDARQDQTIPVNESFIFENSSKPATLSLEIIRLSYVDRLLIKILFTSRL